MWVPRDRKNAILEAAADGRKTKNLATAGSPAAAGEGSKAKALARRTPAAIRQALDALPPAPQRWMVRGEPRPDQLSEDPVRLALFDHGVIPDNWYDPSTDLFLLRHPAVDSWDRLLRSEPLDLHDATLVAAIGSCVSLPGPGQRTPPYRNVRDTISGVIKNHPGPVGSIRLDSSECPPPEELEALMDLLSEKNVQQVLLINLTRPPEDAFPLHRLRSGGTLTRLALGLFSLGDKDLLAGGDDDEGRPWFSSLTHLSLSGCSFQSRALSAVVSKMASLRELTVGLCDLTNGLSQDNKEAAAMTIDSASLVSLRLWDCLACSGITLGYMPRLGHLSVGIVHSACHAAAGAGNWMLSIDLGMACNTMRELLNLDLQRHNIELGSTHAVTISRRRLLSIPYLHTLSVSLNMSTNKDASVLLGLLRRLPQLKALTLRRLDSTCNNEDTFPSLYKVPCLEGMLKNLTFLCFRRGDADVSFISTILASSHSLQCLTIQTHSEMNGTLEGASKLLSSFPRVSRRCQIVLLPPTSSDYH